MSDIRSRLPIGTRVRFVTSKLVPNATGEVVRHSDAWAVIRLDPPYDTFHGSQGRGLYATSTLGLRRLQILPGPRLPNDNEVDP